jgi:hypothetical protein
MTLKKYKFIDIVVFITLSVVFELLNYFASVKWFSDFKLVFMSYSIVLSLICIFRWGYVGALCAGFGGLAACAVAGSNDLVQYLAYGLGNLTVLIPAFIIQKFIGKKKIQENKLIQVAYVIVSFVVVIGFRCLIISLFNIQEFGSTFVESIKLETVMESMSLLISILIMLIAGRKNGNMLVEMIGYIVDVQDHMKLGGLKSYKEQPNFNLDRPFTENFEIDESYLLDGGTLSKDQLDELDELFKDDVQGQPSVEINDNSVEK